MVMHLPVSLSQVGVLLKQINRAALAQGLPSTCPTLSLQNLDNYVSTRMYDSLRAGIPSGM